MSGLFKTSPGRETAHRRRVKQTASKKRGLENGEEKCAKFTLLGLCDWERQCYSTDSKDEALQSWEIDEKRVEERASSSSPHKIALWNQCKLNTFLVESLLPSWCRWPTGSDHNLREVHLTRICHNWRDGGNERGMGTQRKASVAHEVFEVRSGKPTKSWVRQGQIIPPPILMIKIASSNAIIWYMKKRFFFVLFPRRKRKLIWILFVIT